ncbi:uncharacterized protein LOC114361228, partial [Ostrinia furnacalis]|uniref:uncharacterized protein LOC114361228 n=1 Tax=Ostrinia furnacalis TaxID=93504 RepID=UPI00104049EA
MDVRPDDVSKAFDKVPSFGIPVGLCKWISDFHVGRSIRVVLDGFTSSQQPIKAGVPQGSVLSSTLFLLHINDLLKAGTFGYADDTTVTAKYLSMAKASKREVKSCHEFLIKRLNLALQDVSDWGDANLFQFNVSKTQVHFVWLQYSEMRSVGRGEVLVSLCWQPAAARLTVVLLKARNLPKMDVTGLADP